MLATIEGYWHAQQANFVRPITILLLKKEDRDAGWYSINCFETTYQPYYLEDTIGFGLTDRFQASLVEKWTYY